MKNIKNFGGLLSYGIPDFRLPREIIKETLQKILNLGIEVFFEKELGKDIRTRRFKGRI